MRNDWRTFEHWKAAVDAYIERYCGLTSDDLPDWDYYSAYVDGVSPREAAHDAVAAAKE